jgi:hypothetical protein
MINVIKKVTDIDFFKEGQKEDLFVGRPYSINYNKTSLLISDFWKHKVKGIPQGSFLLAFYDNPFEEEIHEALLLRVLNPSSLPTDNNIIASMVEYYKDNLNTSGKKSDLDDFTKYEFSFSGLECRILGSFYKEGENFEFGADVENFYSAHNYKVFKATGKILELIVNQRDKDIVAGGESEYSIGKVRYSSSRRFNALDEAINKVEVFINPGDMLGKRTALFGMTRTGKSNSVKKIIEATVEISKKAKYSDLKSAETSDENFMEPLDKETGAPKFQVGQIIFDINGEYANANMQDKGTAIFDLYSSLTTRYSTLQKDGFKIMKVNFYNDLEAGFELVRSHLLQSSNNYIDSFCAVDFTKPDDYDFFSSEGTRYDRLKAAYFCCLYKANIPVPKGFKVKFRGNDILNKMVKDDGTLVPDKGISLEEAYNWFKSIADNYNTHEYFSKYKAQKGHEWADEDLKAILVFLSRKKDGRNVDGYVKLRSLKDLHTDTVDKPFDVEIIEELRLGRIIVIDLSQGNPEIQTLYSERICRRIFNDSMARFIKNSPNNFVQFYFEEAHNLFPKKDDKDLSQIYNRIAKEGAKLNLGMIYATQEVSSISSNILKNTQNWFIAHLNNEDETRELRKYYDFADFTESLVRFSAKNDKGFVRMKTYSNPFVVPVQIDQFLANK